MVTLVNRAKVATATTGTGTITLGSAESGYQTFADAGVANADVVRYVIEDGTAWEIGTGTYTATGTTLTRTVSESSNADAAIVLTGSATVFIGATAEDILSNVVEDTTPQLGGNLDVNAKAINFGDSNGTTTNMLTFGVGSDLKIYHDSATNKSHITETGSSHLVIQGQEIQFKNASGTSLLDMNSAQVELKFNGSKKIETETNGVTVTGNVTVSGTVDGRDIATNIPASLGTAGQVLTVNSGASAGEWADAGGGDPALYRDNASGATTPTASGSNAVAIGTKTVASGYESFAAAIGHTGYGATGQNSVALGMRGRATALYSASLGGYQSTSSGSYAISAGQQNSASATYSVTMGGRNNQATATGSAILGGFSNTASGLYSRAGGLNADTKSIISKDSWSSGMFSASGDAQTATLVLRSDTTDATAEALTTNNATAAADNQVILPNNSVYGFTGTIIARENSAQTNDFAVWEVKGGAVRAASASTTALGSYNINKISESTGAANWSIAISADTTNGAIAFTVTGEASHSIRWVATINTTEVTY